MPSFEFVARSATLFIQAGEGPLVSRPQHSLGFRVALSSVDRIRLATNEKFQDLKGFVVVKPAPITEAIDKIVGAIHYLKDNDEVPIGVDYPPARYSVEVEIPIPQFEALLDSARSGRVPESINISVMKDKGIRERDGSGMEWDNVNAPKVPVSEVTFTVPFVVPTDQDDLEQKLLPDLAPPTRAQLDQLMQQLTQQFESLSAEIAKVRAWVPIAIAVLAVVLWFR